MKSEHEMVNDDQQPDPRLTATALEELTGLLAAVSLDEASTEQWRRVNELLISSEAARRFASEFLEDECALRHQFGLFNRVAIHSGPETTGLTASRQPATKSLQASPPRVSALSRGRRLILLVAATAAMIAVVLTLRLSMTPAAVAEAVGVVLHTSDATASNLARNDSFHAGDTITADGGITRLRFHCGANVVLKGPVELEVLSPMRAILHRGTLTAKVEESAHGFRIDTRNTKVTDLGTEFGVSVDELGATNTVVFSGEVALQYEGVIPLDISDPAPEVPLSNVKLLGGGRLLTDGEAIRISQTGEAHRLVMIRDDDYPRFNTRPIDETRKRVIEDVSDIIRNGQSVKCYRISKGGFQEDARAFVDRNYEWNGISKEHGLPSFLRGADYVLPFCDDKTIESLEVTVTLGRPARLFVLLDNRLEIPRWLQRDFADTGHDVAIDENAYSSERSWVFKGIGAGVSLDRTCSVWARDVPEPGKVVLGGIKPPSDWSVMYGIAAVALEEAVAAPLDALADHEPKLGDGLAHPGMLPPPIAATTWERVKAFEQVGLDPPAVDDAASWESGVVFRAQTLGGRLKPHQDVTLLEGGVLPALNDGLLSRNADDLERNAWYNDHGRFTADLGTPTRIRSINAYSRHKWGRSLQYFTVWGSNSSEMPSVDFERAAEAEGWDFIGLVDTRFEDPGGVHVSQLRSASGDIGPYRHLLWIVERSEQSTFFAEIDVHSAE